MNSTEYLHLIKTEAARLAEVPAANLDQGIPHIAGWTVGAVVGHTGWVSRYVTEALAATPDAPPSRSAIPEPPHGIDVLAWFSEGVDALTSALESVDPDKPCPTFTGTQPASWWVRRMAHEFSMHRWDSFSAIGSPAPIDTDLARDGIDEVLDVMVPSRMRFETLGGAGETMHLHATDIDDGEWSLTLNADSVEWEHSHSKGDVAARGPVSDLLLMVWSRIPPSRLELFGDATILERWQEAGKF